MPPEHARAVPAPAAPGGGERFLFYSAPARGQGVGNSLQGLASALLLGEQYGRTVCVWWKAFELAFERRGNAGCPSKTSLYTAEATASTSLLGVDHWLELWDFGQTMESPIWRAALSGASRHVVMQGNLLVEGATDRQARLGHSFDVHFRPTPRLMRLLAGAPTHRTAVHLRTGDGTQADGPRGLLRDAEAWERLREWLPNRTLVLSDSDEAYRQL